jgi:PAS domain S-box-containing protein
MKIDERLFRNTLDHLLEGMQIISFDWKHIYVNDSLAKQSHYSKEQLIGRTMMEMYPGIEETEIFKVLKYCMENRVSRQLETEFVFPDKSKSWFELSIQPIPEGIFILSFDITSRKQAEEKLKYSEDKFRDLTETAFDAIILMDENGHIVSWNRGAELIFGYQKEEVMGRSLTLIMPEKFRSRHQEGMERYITTGEKKVIGKVVELEGIRKNGEIFPIEISISSLDEEGRTIFSGIIRDISERKKSENKILRLNEELEQNVVQRTIQLEEIILELKESEEKFQKAFQGSAAGITITRLSDLTFLDVNDGFLKMTGYLKEELIGRTATEVGLVIDLNKREEVLHGMHELGYARNVELTLVHKSGEIFEVLGSIDTILLNNEKHALNIFYDITVRKTAERKLSAVNLELAKVNNELIAANEHLYSVNQELFSLNERLEQANRIIEEQSIKILKQKDEQLNRVLDSTDVVIWSFDLTGNGQDYLSRSAEKIYGKPLQQLMNNQVFWMEAVNSPDLFLAKASFEEVKKTGISESTYRILTSENKIRWIRQQLRLIKDENGKDNRLEGIASDVSNLKEAEDSIQRYRRNLEIIFHNTTSGFLLLDNQSRVVLFNKTFENVFSLISAGKKIETGKGLAELTVEERKEPAQISFEKAMSGEIVLTETEFSTTVGKINLELKYEPVFNDGKVTHVSIAVTDITQKKQLEEERRKVELFLHERELVELKSRFIAMASHEFRTPLASIILNANMIRKYRERFSLGQIDEKLLGIIGYAESMNVLLDDVLTIGRVDAGKLDAVFTEIDLHEFFQTIVTEIQQTSQGMHPIHYNFLCAETQVISDKKLLRNIVTNLLTNSVKFSPAGFRVDFDVTCDQLFFTIRIKDYGVGIPDEDIKRLFEPFFRAGNVHNIQGTGLGLAIAKRATEILKGNISLESQVGKGTVFTVTLPKTKDKP